MTDADRRRFINLAYYVGVAVANMLAIAIGAGLAAGTLPGFRDGEPFAPAAPSMVALLAVVTPILTAWLASNRPRFGSEELAHDVDEARKAGVSRKRMAIRPKNDDDTFTAAQVQQISDDLERRMKATPSKARRPAGQIPGVSD